MNKIEFQILKELQKELDFKPTKFLDFKPTFLDIFSTFVNCRRPILKPSEEE